MIPTEQEIKQEINEAKAVDRQLGEIIAGAREIAQNTAPDNFDVVFRAWVAVRFGQPLR